MENWLLLGDLLLLMISVILYVFLAYWTQKHNKVSSSIIFCNMQHWWQEKVSFVNETIHLLVQVIVQKVGSKPIMLKLWNGLPDLLIIIQSVSCGLIWKIYKHERHFTSSTRLKSIPEDKWYQKLILNFA